jgi:hypothetical protein
MKALNHVTWYISLLLTIVIVYSSIAWEKKGEVYEKIHQGMRYKMIVWLVSLASIMSGEMGLKEESRYIPQREKNKRLTLAFKSLTLLIDTCTNTL